MITRDFKSRDSSEYVLTRKKGDPTVFLEYGDFNSGLTQNSNSVTLHAPNKRLEKNYTTPMIG